MTAVDPNKLVATTAVWRDLNGNRNYDLGEVNPIPIPDCHREQHGVGVINRDQKPDASTSFRALSSGSDPGRCSVHRPHSNDINATMTRNTRIVRGA
jgi:hypothetical protein